MKKRSVFNFKYHVFLIPLLAVLISCAGQTRWYRGNTHTHTLWSDGNAPPEVSIAWYQNNGYDFLALSDHNILSQGEKWVPVVKLNRETIKQICERFGPDWPLLSADGTMMRLKTLPELRPRFNILLIQAEEITDQYQKRPVHVNGINLDELIAPRGGNSVYEVMQNNVDAVLEQSKKTGTPMLAHLNHPNFGWGVTAEDLIKLKGDRFFEVYNGHPGVRNWGDEAHPGTDRMWDIINSVRLQTGQPPLLGVATDDTHQYYVHGVGHSNAGRGWVMVRADALTPNAIVTAMQCGDFYATTGVILNDITFSKQTLSVKIKQEEGVNYRVLFIGTLRGFDSTSKQLDDSSAHVSRSYSHEIGQVLLETTENPAIYRFTGKELYVRAKIISDKKQPNPFQAGDVEMAWTQPAVP